MIAPVRGGAAPGRPVDGDQGSGGVGLAAGALSLIMLAMFAVGALRLGATSAAVSGAAAAAADSAARAGTEPEAVAAAEAVVNEQLGGSEAGCRRTAVSVEVRPAGSGPRPDPADGRVHMFVRVRCEVDLASVVPVGFPAVVVVERTAVEPVDRFVGGRAR